MLRKLFPRKQIETSKQTPNLTPAQNHIMQQFLGPRGLPSMPAAAQKAFELSINPNAEARDFVEVIKADEAMSARVLKIANSVFFDRGKKSETVDEAVLIIGLAEIRGLMSATTLNELFPTRHPAREQFWSNAIATAVAARLLAGRAVPEFLNVAFTAGLLHDIGKLLMLQRATDQYDKVLKDIQHSGSAFNDAEAKQFIFDHTQLGHYLAERWNFSAELTIAIRCHHDPWSANDLTAKSKPGLAQLIKSADLMAHGLGLGHTTGYSKLQKNCEALMNPAFNLFSIKPEEQQSFLETIKTTYQKELDLYLQ